MLENFIRPELKAELESLRSKECTDSFTAEVVAVCSPEGSVTNTENRTRESGHLKEDFTCMKMLLVYSKTYRWYFVTTKK